MNRWILLGVILVAIISQPLPVSAQRPQPGPGDLYREYVWYAQDGKDWRVTDPEAVATFPQAAEFLPNPVREIDVTDLEGAVRADLTLDRWGGHRGTVNKRVRLNGQAWITVPELQHVPATLRPEMLMFQDNPTVPVPLEHLRPGRNLLEAGCDERGGFGWGQWGINAAVLRVFYDSNTKGPQSNVHGRIVWPTPGAVLQENPEIVIEASGTYGVARIDLFASYDGYDEDGDGAYDGWHCGLFQLFRGDDHLLHYHVATLWQQPYQARWDTYWLPDQPTGSIQLVARIQNSRGFWTVTDPVGDLSLERDGTSVRLYRAEDVPEDFGVRIGQRLRCTMSIPEAHDLGQAIAAALHLRTWHGSDADHMPLRINDTPLTIGGKNHHFDYDLLPFEPSRLVSGRNDFTVQSDTEHHQLEVLWPGPAIVVRYERQATGEENDND